MKNIKQSLKEIYQKDRILLYWMIFILLFGMVLCIFSIIKLSPNSSVIRMGYSDIGGYKDGVWTNMLVYPLIALLFSIGHNLMIVKIYKKNGFDAALVFAIITIILIAATFVTLVRLLGES